jgi:hypothetical protein
VGVRGVVGFHRVPQALGAQIGPHAFDVVEAILTSRSAFAAELDPPSSWDLGERRPQRALLLIVHENVEAAFVIVKRVAGQVGSSEFGYLGEPNIADPGVVQSLEGRLA